MMETLRTESSLALSILLNEDIYVFKEDVEEVQTVTNLTSLPAEPQNTEPINETVKPKPSFNYLGENNKSVLVIVNDPESEFLNQTDLIFLLKILSAKKLELRDIAILNLAKHTDYEFENLKSFFACNKILTYGIHPNILGMQGLTSNALQEFNGVKFLGTWSLRQMVNDDNKKRTYWNVLKLF